MEVPDHSDFIAESNLFGYKVFLLDNRALNLNIVGWRNREGRVDRFDDVLSVYWEGRDFEWYQKSWPITTKPGIPWLLNPENEDGTAILAPGQYEQAYEVGLHKGTSPALVQVEPVAVYRDNNWDGLIDLNPDTIEKGMFGINIHKAGIISKIVGVSSAGCQVFQKSADFDDFMALCGKASSYWGNRFTYTLLEI